MGKTVGIDLGTTNSVVAVMDGDEPKVLVNSEGDRVTPSVVAWDDRGEVLVGQIAKRQAVTNPERTVYSAKRFIGRTYEETKPNEHRFPFKLAAQPSGGVGFQVADKTLAPPEVSAHVLRKLKKAAEDHLGTTVDSAVITVPAYFNDAQRQATKDAGRIAGLEVKRIVNEPTAAALAYGLDKKGDRLVAVYDLGGGTFDISILEVSESVIQVLSTSGDTQLGGDDFDELLIEEMIAAFKKQEGIDVSEDRMVRQRLKDAAEKAKIELSQRLETDINLPFLTATAAGPKHLTMTISRARFESLIEKLVDRTFKAVEAAIKDAKKTPKDIDEVILVGGSTRVPMVQKRVTDYFGREPHRGVNPDEVVALGAAVQAGVLTGDVKDMLLLDVTPLSLGVETEGGVMTTLIPRNTTIPTRKEEVFSTAVDSQPRVDVHVLQGERAQAADNRTLGKFHLEGIAPAPRGVPQIAVAFDIDANGILSVTATDKATGKEQKITITANSGLSEAEIQAMVDKAKEYEQEDTRFREEAQARNALDQASHVLRRAAEQGELDPALKSEVDDLLAEVTTALERRDGDAVRELMARVEDLHKRVAMSQAPAAAEEGDAPPKGGKDDGVIDAEYEDVA